MDDTKIKRLTSLSFGEKAVVHSCEETELYIKLLEMGCVPGEELTVEMKAPFGDPISIQIAGYRLSLRKEEADQILVIVP